MEDFHVDILRASPSPTSESVVAFVSAYWTSFGSLLSSSPVLTPTHSDLALLPPSVLFLTYTAAATKHKGKGKLTNRSADPLPLICARYAVSFVGRRGMHICGPCWKNFSADHEDITLPDERTISATPDPSNRGWKVHILAFSCTSPEPPRAISIPCALRELQAMIRVMIRNIPRPGGYSSDDSRYTCPLSASDIQTILSQMEASLLLRLEPQEDASVLAPVTQRFPPISAAHHQDRMALWRLQESFQRVKTHLVYLQRQFLSLASADIALSIPSQTMKNLRDSLLCWDPFLLLRTGS